MLGLAFLLLFGACSFCTHDLSRVLRNLTSEATAAEDLRRIESLDSEDGVELFCCLAACVLLVRILLIRLGRFTGRPIDCLFSNGVCVTRGEFGVGMHLRTLYVIISSFWCDFSFRRVSHCCLQ